MFLNIYGKRIRSSLRNWEMLLWTWIFPLMLATLFYFAFSGLDSADLLDVIPTGIVADQEYKEDTVFQAVLNAVSSESDDPLLDLTVYETEEDAKNALESQDIDGYIVCENGTPRLSLAKSGLNQTILKSFLDQYIQGKHTITALLAQNPDAGPKISSLFDKKSFTEEISLSKNKPSQSLSYFYALLAMVCMYGGFQGMESVSYLQANLSPLGARRTMSPARRIQLVFYDLLAALTIHFICLLFLLAYVTLILKVSFGPNILPVILTCLLGSMLGLSFGALLTAATRFKEGVKTALIITVSLLCSYGAGLMISGINYTIAQNIPILSWINPAARIADAFYCLYYYDNYSQFFLNLVILAAMTVTMLAITTFFLRRQRYESI